MNNNIKLFFFAFSLLLQTSFALYGANSPVIKLDSSNFKKEVINSKDIWLVEFYAPWCGHCKQFAPEFEKAAKALQGILKIGAVDADSQKELAAQYEIKGFPTIKFFGTNKSKPVDYQGGRTADAVVAFMIDKASSIAKSRLSGKKSSSSSSSDSKKASSEKKQEKPTGSTNEKDVIVLTDDNFDELVYNNKKMWLIEFYAPWCGHCQKLQPEWNQAATQLKGSVALAKVDATVQNRLASRFNVKGYPTIKIFPPINKSDSTAEDYEGPREAVGIVSFALNKLEEYGYVPDITQLISQETLKDTCIDRNGICVISLLSNIVDSSAKERNNYLEQLKEVSKSTRGKPIYFLWAQGGDFFDFEDKLHLSFGYPAVVAINFSKKKYSICRMSFSKDNIKNYIVNLLSGKEPLQNLSELPQLKKVAEWDKKDAPAPQPENDDL